MGIPSSTVTEAAQRPCLHEPNEFSPDSLSHDAYADWSFHVPGCGGSEASKLRKRRRLQLRLWWWIQLHWRWWLKLHWWRWIQLHWWGWIQLHWWRWIQLHWRWRFRLRRRNLLGRWMWRWPGSVCRWWLRDPPGDPQPVPLLRTRHPSSRRSGRQ